MPSPKSGNTGSAVAPAAPTAAFDADDASPGAVEQIKATQLQTQTGKYGSVQTPPYKSNPAKKSWIEIKLVDEEKNPVPGEPYSITLPDATVASGTLDDKGFARIDGIDPGTCQITFPQRDTAAWKKA
jgi:type VI secretion system secreted protein VgrG